MLALVRDHLQLRDLQKRFLREQERTARLLFIFVLQHGVRVQREVESLLHWSDSCLFLGNLRTGCRFLDYWLLLWDETLLSLCPFVGAISLLQLIVVLLLVVVVLLLLRRRLPSCATTGRTASLLAGVLGADCSEERLLPG